MRPTPRTSDSPTLLAITRPGGNASSAAEDANARQGLRAGRGPDSLVGPANLQSLALMAAQRAAPVTAQTALEAPGIRHVQIDPRCIAEVDECTVAEWSVFNASVADAVAAWPLPSPEDLHGELMRHGVLMFMVEKAVRRAPDDSLDEPTLEATRQVMRRRLAAIVAVYEQAARTMVVAWTQSNLRVPVLRDRQEIRSSVIIWLHDKRATVFKLEALKRELEHVADLLGQVQGTDVEELIRRTTAWMKDETDRVEQSRPGVA